MDHWVALLYPSSPVLKACHNNLHWEALVERWVCSTKHDPTLAIWPHVLTVPLKPPALEPCWTLCCPALTQGSHPGTLPFAFLSPQTVSCSFLHILKMFPQMAVLTDTFAGHLVQICKCPAPTYTLFFFLPCFIGFPNTYHWTYCIFLCLITFASVSPGDSELLRAGIWEFPGNPVVRTWCFHCHGLGSIPGQETKIL